MVTTYATFKGVLWYFCNKRELKQEGGLKMFIGLIVAVLIIVGYAIHASKKYALKTDIEELERRVTELEETSSLKQNET